MKITGIIAEYNPFHTGHQYHLQQARELTGADYIVVAMSGDFVQRGGPAVFDKYLRARMALTCGADLVLEIPSAFATSSAEDFASCGVALLNGLGAVTALCFGSECGNSAALMDAARLLLGESEEFSQLLQRGLKSGLTFPAARQAALEELYAGTDSASIAPLITSPNNILGLEYCKAILRQGAFLEPVTLLRQGAGYHDALSDEAGPGQGFASASGIRRALSEHQGALPEEILPFLPAALLEGFQNARPVWPGDFSALLNAAILAGLPSNPGFRPSYDQYSDFTPDLALRLAKMGLTFASWEERAAQLKTRQYTYTRINRALTHLLLKITSDILPTWKAAGYAPYARILGFNRDAAPLLSELHQASRIPLITRPAAALRTLNGPARSLFESDLYSSHLYQCVYQQKYGCTGANEFARKLLVL